MRVRAFEGATPGCVRMDATTRRRTSKAEPATAPASIPRARTLASVPSGPGAPSLTRRQCSPRHACAQRDGCDDSPQALRLQTCCRVAQAGVEAAGSAERVGAREVERVRGREARGRQRRAQPLSRRALSRRSTAD